MTSDPIFQESLFADPLGLRFRHMREKAHWTVEAVAQQLKLPTSVINAIEKEDWARLGAPIYIRSYVGSYARLVGFRPSWPKTSPRQADAAAELHGHRFGRTPGTGPEHPQHRLQGHDLVMSGRW